MKKILKFAIFVSLVFLILFSLSLRLKPQHPVYGVSFSKFHSDELKLDWKKVYLALLNDLKVRNLRLSAHWPNTEPAEGKFNFSELDFQMQEAQKRGASVILAVGRRLPGWPECHDPQWIQNLKPSKESSRSSPPGQAKFKDQKEFLEFRNKKLLEYIEAVVNRYKGFDNLKYWQVENEPYFNAFASSACGTFDENFLKKEISLVRQLDPGRPILLTDSGEWGTWYKAYKNGNAFGTTMYLYVYFKQWGISKPIKYPLVPAFYRIKRNIIEAMFGKKPSLVIELSAEPWLLKPIVDTPVEVQLERMGIDKFREMIDFGRKTGFDTFYLWGAEWWYWMKTQQNHPEFWEEAKTLLMT
jgi:hypothetical protein